MYYVYTAVCCVYDVCLYDHFELAHVGAFYSLSRNLGQFFCPGFPVFMAVCQYVAFLYAYCHCSGILKAQTWIVGRILFLKAVPSITESNHTSRQEFHLPHLLFLPVLLECMNVICGKYT